MNLEIVPISKEETLHSSPKRSHVLPTGIGRRGCTITLWVVRHLPPFSEVTIPQSDQSKSRSTGVLINQSPIGLRMHDHLLYFTGLLLRFNVPMHFVRRRAFRKLPAKYLIDRMESKLLAVSMHDLIRPQPRTLWVIYIQDSETVIGINNRNFAVTLRPCSVSSSFLSKTL
jgi:hypothetical protein